MSVLPASRYEFAAQLLEQAALFQTQLESERFPIHFAIENNSLHLLNDLKGINQPVYFLPLFFFLFFIFL